MKLHTPTIEPLDSQVNKGDSKEILKIPFSMNIVAQKGGGKTTLLLNLLSKPVFFRNKFDQIIYVSPTHKLDAKIHETINKDILKPHPKKKNNIYNKILDTQEEEQRLFFFETFEPEFFKGLMDSQEHMIQTKGKTKSPDILLILDDCITLDFIKSRFFLKVILNSRHYKISVILNSQTYYSVPKSIRLNTSLLVLFEITNELELKNIFAEHSCGLSNDEFLAVFKEITNIDYNFMTVNYQGSKKKRLMLNFENYIEI